MPVIEELEKRQKESQPADIQKALDSIIKLFNALENRGIAPSDVDEQLKSLKRVLNAEIRAKSITAIYNDITRRIQKLHQLVTPGFYKNQWMVLGMTAFGLPIGLMISILTDNMALLATGLPIGMVLGMALGIQKDKKAMEEGLVLILE